MRERPYLRAAADTPKLLLAAYVVGGIAVVLLALGLLLDALPEEGALEWNGLPLGEYGTGDVWPSILLFSVAGAVCAGVSLVPLLGVAVRGSRAALGGMAA